MHPKSIIKQKKKDRDKLARVILMEEAGTSGGFLLRVTVRNDVGPQPLLLVRGDRVTLLPRVSSKVRSELHPPPPSTGGAKKGENAKTGKLKWQTK